MLILKKYIFLWNVLLFLIFVTSCSEEESVNKKMTFVTSNNPIAFIVSELISEHDDVICLVPPGTSEHIFQPRPLDINKLEKADAIFYVSDFLDSWILKSNNHNMYALLTYLNDSDLLSYNFEQCNHIHYHDDTHEIQHSEQDSDIDPHFWTDPILVKKIVYILTDLLQKINPQDSALYSVNASIFVSKLDSLNHVIDSTLFPYRGKSVMLFHPSFLYFLKRYGLEYAGSIETIPGKEPTIREIVQLKKTMKKLQINTIFYEPQLPRKSVEPFIVRGNLRALILDPLGGYEGRMNYFDLMMFNTMNIKKSFE